MEKIMSKVTATLAIIIAVIGVIVLMPAIPFIASAGILLLIAAGLAEMSKPKKQDADTQA
jgi:flagellar biosynthesis component FlhA